LTSETPWRSASKGHRKCRPGENQAETEGATGAQLLDRTDSMDGQRGNANGIPHSGLNPGGMRKRGSRAHGLESPASGWRTEIPTAKEGSWRGKKPMEGQDVRMPAMAANVTDSTVDESPEVEATGNGPLAPATAWTSYPTRVRARNRTDPEGRKYSRPEGETSKVAEADSPARAGTRRKPRSVRTDADRPQGREVEERLLRQPSALPLEGTRVMRSKGGFRPEPMPRQDGSRPTGGVRQDDAAGKPDGSRYEAASKRMSDEAGGPMNVLSPRGRRTRTGRGQNPWLPHAPSAHARTYLQGKRKQTLG